MFRDILISRDILVGLIFFVLVVGGSLLYSWYTRVTTDAELAPSQRLLRQRANPNETHTAADTVESPPVDFDTSQTPFSSKETQASTDDPEAFSSDDTAPGGIADDVITEATTDGENDPPEVSESVEKAIPSDESAEDLQTLTPEQLEALEERKRAETLLQQFLESHPDIEIPLEEILKDPAIASKIERMNVQLIGPGRFYIHTPAEVREAIRIVEDNE